MAQEVYKVFNSSNEASISIMLRRKLTEEDLSGLSQQKRRRIVRSGGVPVKIPTQSTVDLVKETGLSVESIKDSPELIQTVSSGRLQVMEVVVIEEVEEKVEVEAKPVVSEPKPTPKPKKPKKKVEAKVEPKVEPKEETKEDKPKPEPDQLV